MCWRPSLWSWALLLRYRYCCLLAAAAAPTGATASCDLAAAGPVKWKQIEQYSASYVGSYSFSLNISPPNPVETEGATYQWQLNDTKTIDMGKTSAGTAVYCELDATRLVANGTSKQTALPGTSSPNIDCNFHTPQGYGWTSAIPLDHDPAKSQIPLTFSWSIASTPRPGAPGVTGGSEAGTQSGCTVAGEPNYDYGLPKFDTQSNDVPISPSQQLAFDHEATNGGSTLTVAQLPQNKAYNIDGNRSTDLPGGTHEGGTLTFHAAAHHHQGRPSQLRDPRLRGGQRIAPGRGRCHEPPGSACRRGTGTRSSDDLSGAVQVGCPGSRAYRFEDHVSTGIEENIGHCHLSRHCGQGTLGELGGRTLARKPSSGEEGTRFPIHPHRLLVGPAEGEGPTTRRRISLWWPPRSRRRPPCSDSAR